MWPWEHAAVGYLTFSLGRRGADRSPPTGIELFAVVLGTQLPDLVDKPLSWQFGLFPSGFAVTHSVLIAGPAGMVILVVALQSGWLGIGAAFVVGYWTHLLGDVFTPLRRGAPPDLSRVLWPISEPRPYERDLGLGRGLGYLSDFLVDIAVMDISALVLNVLALPTVAILVWLVDGAPGVPAGLRIFLMKR